MQVSLMKTEKDAILRLAASFAQPQPPRDYHWYQIMGTQGSVEWRRSARERPKMWLAKAQMHDMAEVDWQFQRTDAPTEARGSGHGDADYYVHAAFRDAVRGTRPLEFDLYRAMDTAAGYLGRGVNCAEFKALVGAGLSAQCGAACRHNAVGIVGGRRTNAKW